MPPRCAAPCRAAPTGRRRRRGLAGVTGLAATVATVAIVAACSSGSSTADPQALLADAKATLDATPGLHFDLASSGAPTSGTVLTGGSGDVARPDGFQGALKVTRSGLQLTVAVISVGGVVYLKPPLVAGYSRADPKTYGFSDPGQLLDPSSGITSLLTEATQVRAAGRERFHGEVLEQVDVTLPGTAVARALTSADPSRPVTGRLGIVASSHELRRAVLTGPFLAADVSTTFTIVLDHYGQHPTIRAPG